MITKEDFVDAIHFIQQQEKKADKFMTALEELCPDNIINAFIYADYEAQLLHILGAALNDTNDEIGYYLYELGGIDQDVTVDNHWEHVCFPTNEEGEYIYTSLDTLYDYLIIDYDKRK